MLTRLTNFQNEFLNEIKKFNENKPDKPGERITIRAWKIPHALVRPTPMVIVDNTGRHKSKEMDEGGDLAMAS